MTKKRTVADRLSGTSQPKQYGISTWLQPAKPNKPRLNTVNSTTGFSLTVNILAGIVYLGGFGLIEQGQFPFREGTPFRLISHLARKAACVCLHPRHTVSLYGRGGPARNGLASVQHGAALPVTPTFPSLDLCQWRIRQSMPWNCSANSLSRTQNLWGQMTDDPNVWKAARNLVDRYGEDALRQACLRVEELRGEGHRDAHAFWVEVSRAVKLLRGMEPDTGDR